MFKFLSCKTATIAQNKARCKYETKVQLAAGGSFFVTWRLLVFVVCEFYDQLLENMCCFQEIHEKKKNKLNAQLCNVVKVKHWSVLSSYNNLLNNVFEFSQIIPTYRSELWFSSSLNTWTRLQMQMPCQGDALTIGMQIGRKAQNADDKAPTLGGTFACGLLPFMSRKSVNRARTMCEWSSWIS